MAQNEKSRRDFLKESAAGVVGVTVLSHAAVSNAAGAIDTPSVDKKQLVSALGDTIIPTAPGYSGYQHLEAYGITDEVLKALPGITQQDMDVFNAATREFFGGKSFVELSADQRTEFLTWIVASFPAGSYSDSESKPEQTAKLGANVKTLQQVFRTVRNRILVTFYRNFPEDKVARDKNDLPLLPPGDQHQIVNPNTKQLVTGWDVAGFPGPLTWEEEEARRAKWMKIKWFKD